MDDWSKTTNQLLQIFAGVVILAPPVIAIIMMLTLEPYDWTIVR